MNKELKYKVDLVCEAINKVFANNEQRRVNQILEFSSVVAQAPNEELLEEAVDMILSSMLDAFESIRQ